MNTLTRSTKATLGGLAIIAALTVYGLVATFRSAGISLRANVSGQHATLPSPDDDVDHDGLSNEDESYWNTDFQNPDTDGDGFKDGEEIASGHDPTIPGPDDILIGTHVPQNITEKVAGLVAGGLADGALKKDSRNLDASLAALTDEVVVQYRTNLAAQSAGPLSYQLVVNTSDTLEAYKNAMHGILKDMDVGVAQGFQQLIIAAGRIDQDGGVSYAAFFTQEDRTLNNFLVSLQAVPVPQSWSSQHRELLAFVQNLKKNYALLKSSDEDPYQAMVAFPAIAKLTFEKFPTILGTYRDIYHL